MNNTTHVKCKYCKQEFLSQRPKSRPAKYCSTVCCNRDRLLGKGVLQPKPCLVCGSMYKPQRSTTKFCSNQCSAKWKSQDLAYLEKLKTACILRSQKPEYLEILSQRAKERWNTKEFQIKMRDIFNSDEWLEKSLHTYTAKEYVMPSGKKVYVQGYEDQALDELLKKYDESDILVDRKDIRKKIGQITYKINEKIHQYIPDIYIISEMRIIEVKSEWTYRVNEEVNLLKRDAVLSRGLSFDFMII